MKPAPKAVMKKKAPKLVGLEFTSAELSLFIPRWVPGCRLSVETEWHHRVRVTYPRDDEMGHFDAMFLKAGSQRAAAIRCIRWAWAEHMRATGVTCPWEIPEE